MDLGTIYDTLKIFGYRWTLEILTSLAQSPKRFNELQRDVANFNPKTHADALNRLVKHGLIHHEDGDGSYYAVTAKGEWVVPALRNFVTEMSRWDQLHADHDRSHRP